MTRADKRTYFRIKWHSGLIITQAHKPGEDDDVVDAIPLAAKVYLAVGVLIVIGCIIEALR